MKKFKLSELKKEIDSCQKCKLFEKRTKTVFGYGNISPKIMFIGEAPGDSEDKSGKPFQGRSGDLLDDMLENIGLTRNDVFITNLVKCRPPENRKPEKEEISMCHGYLDKQLEIIKPEVICPLGSFSSKYILYRFGFEKIAERSITEIRGRLYSPDKYSFPDFIVPMFHPAAILRDPSKKKYMVQDFKAIKEFLL